MARVTSEEGRIGKGHLSRFQELETTSPVILTTSQLLTTGVDAPTCKNNAHPVRQSQGPGGHSLEQYDHKHCLRTIRPYEYQNAATLLADFWTEMDAVLKERGVIP